jgi:predicted RND superfamily exporter protein
MKKRVEDLFETSGRLLYQNPLKVLLVSFAFIAALTFRLPNLTADTSPEAMLHESDPFRLEYNAFRDQFGRDEIIVIAVEAPDLFCADFLEKLKAIHHDLENEVPYLKEVSSLINARRTYGNEDVLLVEELLEDWPQKPVDLAALREFVLGNPLYLNNLISEDGGLTAILIETQASIGGVRDHDPLLSRFDDDAPGAAQTPVERHYLAGQEGAEVLRAVRTVVDRYRSHDFTLLLSGGPLIVDAFDAAAMKGMKLASILAIVTVIAVLTLFFRRVSGVILPVIIVVAAVLSTLGVMAHIRVPLTMTTNLIAALLIAVGVADSVHVLAIFYRRLEQGSSKEDSIAYALRHSGLAIVLTSLTTAVGFLSFSFAELSSIAELGLYSAAGVMLALLYTVVILPSVLAIIPIRPDVASRKGSPFVDHVLLSFARFSTAYPREILGLSLVVFVMSFVFVLDLTFSHDPISGFPEDATIRTDLSRIDEALKGIAALEVVVDTKHENGIHDPALLRRMEGLARDMAAIDSSNVSVGKIFSINHILKETNQALHGNNPAHYAIPEDQETVAQELLLFEISGSDDLERLVDSQFSKTRITIKTPFVDAVVYREFMKGIEERLHRAFEGGPEVTVTGGMALMARAIPKALRSMAISYVTAAVAISIMMILFVGGVKLGLVSMIPNFLPILLVMGIMGLSGVPLDMTTILIGSIAIGLVVDDTVHFFYNFRRYYDLTGDASKAVRESLLGTGRAMLITSVILGTMFLCNLSAPLSHFHRFGIFCALTVAFALLADFVLAPALLILLTRRRRNDREHLHV